MIGRIIKNGNGFEFCELEDIEIADAIRHLVDFNLSAFKSIYRKVSSMQVDTGIRLTKTQVINIALAIYDNSTLRSYPILQATLLRKINNTKEKNNISKQQQEDAIYQQHADLVREQKAAAEAEEGQ